MNVNVRGTIDLIRQVLPHLATADPVGEDGERGIVIMVASSAAFDGQPGQGRCLVLPKMSVTDSSKSHTLHPKVQSHLLRFL